MADDRDGRGDRGCLECQIETAVREAKALRAAALRAYGQKLRLLLRRGARGAAPSIVAFGRRLLERSP
jgi:hypothetical protein